ncbi:MAG: PIG-L family deacetylase [Pseudomonadota bacterium]
MPGRRLLLVSPHFDDAVLACGQWLVMQAGAVVVTVFAGIPDGFEGVTGWDADCGFSSSRAALDARRAEDDAALALLGCRALRLPFCDAQYGVAADAERVADALGGILTTTAADTVAFPLGLFHSDHILTRDAALIALTRGAAAAAQTLAYEDALYRRLPHATDAALAALRRAGVRIGAPVERDDAAARARKRSALACYRSQLRGLATPGRPGHADAMAPERCWPVVVPLRGS